MSWQAKQPLTNNDTVWKVQNIYSGVCQIHKKTESMAGYIVYMYVYMSGIQVLYLPQSVGGLKIGLDVETF